MGGIVFQQPASVSIIVTPQESAAQPAKETRTEKLPLAQALSAQAALGSNLPSGPAALVKFRAQVATPENTGASH
jgi:hypothetical protein